MASRINPSEEINSEYIKSAPWALHNLRKGGSLTSSIGARSKGNSGNIMLPILTIFIYFGAKLRFLDERIKEERRKT
jgi:hypothetical protein